MMNFKHHLTIDSIFMGLYVCNILLILYIALNMLFNVITNINNYTLSITAENIIVTLILYLLLQIMNTMFDEYDNN